MESYQRIVWDSRFIQDNVTRVLSGQKTKPLGYEKLEPFRLPALLTDGRGSREKKA